MVLANTMLRDCLAQAVAVEDAVRALAPRLAEPAAAADAGNRFVAYAHLLDRSHAAVFVAAAADPVGFTGVGELLTGLLKTAIRDGTQLLDALRTGVGVAADDVRRAVERLQHLLGDHLRGWPWEPVPTRDEAVAAADRGEATDIGDVFAAVAGMSRADWDARVAGRAPLGGG